MDTVRKELVSDQWAKDIFVRIRSRLKTEKIKTNEVYLNILIDEINKYFLDLTTSSIDSGQLPDTRMGPNVKQHNNLLLNITRDIDKIHEKESEVETVITKAVNYLSNERVAVGSTVSKITSRIINKKLRSASNDRHVTVFSEYFTDANYMDESSKNVRVDSGSSSLSLLPINESKDNSNIIEPKDIFIKINMDVGGSDLNKCIYPICNQPEAPINFFASFGRSISDDSIQTTLKNVTNASHKKDDGLDIQRQCLIIGEVKNDIIDQLSESTFGEFELLFNDFASSTLESAIRYGVKNDKNVNSGMDLDDAHILIDKISGNSFNGSKLDSQNITDTSSNILFNNIKTIGLRFKLKAGTSLPGFLSYIRICFAPAKGSLKIPKINLTGSYILDKNNTRYFPFTSGESKENEIIEEKLLFMNSLVSDISEVYIDFDLKDLRPEPILKYLGVCWKLLMSGGIVTTGVNYDGQSLGKTTSLSSKVYTVYHDLKRVSDNSLKEINLPIAKNVIQAVKTNEFQIGTSNVIQQ